jgi:hypothetical protein
MCSLPDTTVEPQLGHATVFRVSLPPRPHAVQPSYPPGFHSPQAVMDALLPCGVPEAVAEAVAGILLGPGYLSDGVPLAALSTPLLLRNPDLPGGKVSAAVVNRVRVALQEVRDPCNLCLCVCWHLAFFPCARCAHPHSFGLVWCTVCGVRWVYCVRCTVWRVLCMVSIGEGWGRAKGDGGCEGACCKKGKEQGSALAVYCACH